MWSIALSLSSSLMNQMLMKFQPMNVACCFISAVVLSSDSYLPICLFFLVMRARFYNTWKLNLAMKRKTVVSLVLVLSFVLVPIVNADCIELKYDDEFSNLSSGKAKGYQVAVRFSLPVQSARLVKARFEISINPSDFEVHVYDLNGNDLVPPLTVTPVSQGWYDVPLNIMVPSDFYIALEYLEDSKPYIAEDSNVVQGHSYQRATSADPWSLNIDGNYMIRAVVCYTPPIGGVLISNTIPTIVSWLIAGITTVSLSAGIALKKKRQI